MAPSSIKIYLLLLVFNNLSLLTVKNRIIASLFLGVGLVISVPPGHARPAHPPGKKHTLATAKHGKKPSALVSKRGKAKKSNHRAFHAKKSSRQLAHRKLTKKTAARNHPHLHQSTAMDAPLYSKLDFELPPVLTPPASNQPLGLNPSHRVHKIIKIGNKLSLVAAPSPTEQLPQRYLTAQGIIRSSFAEAAKEIGLPESLPEQLASIFAWDIDFATKLRRGDQFTVVYERDRTGTPLILAAEFVNQNRILTAVRYIDEFGNSNYYTPEGRAMRKAFLSTPVEFARISSHFDINRRHPVLNRIRAHKGVDYAARTGTPVKTTGDGVIAFLGRKGGYGQVIIVQHGERYETLYAHLSRFRRDLQPGDLVKQGEIIGYVGQTGLATGPHLHYEFRIDGQHRNPELIEDSRHAMTLNPQYLADFKQRAHPLLAQLYQTKAKSLLAKNQTQVE